MSPQEDPTRNPENSAELRRFAQDLGFTRLGVAHAGPSPHSERYREWLAAGRHGTMDYMAREVARRVDPRETLDAARSVVVVSLAYPDEAEFPPEDAPHRGKLARYSRGRDYHKIMTGLLERLAAEIRGDRWRTWYTVDTGPLLERDWAEAAGVGWIGKNGLVIDPELGSWFVLGAVVTDRPYVADHAVADHCGSCRACLDACPTDAFVGERSVDARRCISYLTIEHRGTMDEDLAAKLGGWIFGCDICQEVCPFNRRAQRVSPSTHPDFAARDLPDDYDTLTRLGKDEFLETFMGTAIMRAGVAGMARNARAALTPREDEPECR